MTEQNQEAVKKLKAILKTAKNVVFFGGAGVSTESGIPDFRSSDGLYNQKYKFPPEKILSHSFFLSHTKEFFDFYRDKMVFTSAKPNIVHNKLADWERQGKHCTIVTQNIDGLHEAAGSVQIFNLHGTIHSNTCMDCGAKFNLGSVINTSGIPKCTCGGIIKPDVVLYEEPLDDDVVTGAVRAIASADVLIVGGTSLSVYPAAGFINYFNGRHLVLINKTSTPYDRYATLTINAPLGEVFSQLD